MIYIILLVYLTLVTKLTLRPPINHLEAELIAKTGKPLYADLGEWVESQKSKVRLYSIWFSIICLFVACIVSLVEFNVTATSFLVKTFSVFVLSLSFFYYTSFVLLGLIARKRGALAKIAAIVFVFLFLVFLGLVVGLNFRMCYPTSYRMCVR